MSQKITALYVSADDNLELSRAIIEKLRQSGNEDIQTIGTSGNDFPFAKNLVSHGELVNLNVVILHLLTGCHELGYHRETDENQSTGLRRAEILREEGYQGGIVLISTSPKWLMKRVIHDYDARVEKAQVQFVDYSNIFQDIVDAVRRVGQEQIQKELQELQK